MTVYVITHKKLNKILPQGYKRLLVGASQKNKNDFPNYFKDDVGSNISNKNYSYCELTGMYWLWKHSNSDNIGISHYRRYFSNMNDLVLDTNLVLHRDIKIAENKYLDNALKKYDWIVPKKKELYARVYDNYEACHHIKDLNMTRQVISEKYPDYIKSFDKVMNQDKISCFNMLYTSKENYDNYCQWLFDILFEVEKRIDITSYNQYQKRVFGFLAERLLNIYLLQNNYNILYLNVFNTENEQAGQRTKHDIKKIIKGILNHK